jgi:hypothetical protein
MSKLDIVVERIDPNNIIELVSKLGSRCNAIDQTSRFVSGIPDGLEVDVPRPMFVFVVGDNDMQMIKDMVIGGFRIVIGNDAVEVSDDGVNVSVRGSVDTIFVPNTNGMEAYFSANTKIIGASVFTTGDVADADVEKLKCIIKDGTPDLFTDDGPRKIDIETDPLSGNPTGKVQIGKNVVNVDGLITVVRRKDDLAEYMTGATEIAKTIENLPDEAIDNLPVFLLLDSEHPFRLKELIYDGFQQLEGDDNIVQDGAKLILRKRTTFVFQSHVDNLDELTPDGVNIVGALIMPGYKNPSATVEKLRSKFRDQLKSKLN